MTTNRNAEVAIIGGGPAGLGTALQLGRMRAGAIVIDAGEPRNAPATHMHSYLGHDGTPPSEFLERARDEVDAYGIERIHSRVERIERHEDRHFTLVLSDDTSLTATRLVLAAGVADELPDIPGIAERWGGDVFHCPYCHGWEARDRRIVVIDTNGFAAHQALLLRRLTSDVSIVVHSGQGPDPAQRARLAALGVDVVESRVDSVTGDGEAGMAVRLTDADDLLAGAVVVGPRIRPNLPFIDGLGLQVEDHPSGIGGVVKADPMTGATNVPGVYAVGNLVDPSFQVLHAAAHGTKVGSMVNMALTEEWADKTTASRGEANRWDGMYSRDPDRVWSGAPNGSFAVEASSLPAGRALDVGCGEGADAIWLAQRGWQVTAVDISPLAVERARAAGDAAGVEVDWQRRDLLAEPPAADTFDLVSLQYPALLKAAGTGAFDDIRASVAPGGTMLVVGHAHMHEHHADGEHEHDDDDDGPSFDHADFFGIDELRTLLVESGFEMEVDEVRPRPNPPAGNPHVDDEVLRARRPH